MIPMHVQRQCLCLFTMLPSTAGGKDFFGVTENKSLGTEDSIHMVNVI